MKDIKDMINEAIRNRGRANVGAILEVELEDDGHFYWVDERDYPNMKDWEIRESLSGDGFVIKIGNLKEIK